MAQNKNVLLVVANEGYQQLEYNIPKKLLEHAGFTVITASNKLSPAIAKDGSTTMVDLLVSKANPQDYAGIVFVGGPGTLENLDNEDSYKLIKNAAHAEKPLGAICLATRVFANAGILHHKKATGYNEDNELPGIYKKNDVTYVTQSVVIDDNIITASDPSAATEFGNAVIKVLNHYA